MKKALVIANMLFASTSVLGMNYIKECGSASQPNMILFNRTNSETAEAMGSYASEKEVMAFLVSMGSCDPINNCYRMLEGNKLVDIPEPKRGTTPVVEAIDENNFKMLRTLVDKHGADINKETLSGRFPVIEAVKKDNPEVYSYVLGVKDLKTVNVRDWSGKNALWYAVDNCRPDAVHSLLVEHSANPNISDSEGRTPLILIADKLVELSERFKDVNERKEYYESTVPYYKMARYLINHGAENDIKDNKGRTASSIFSGDSYFSENLVLPSPFKK